LERCNNVNRVALVSFFNVHLRQSTSL